MATVYVKYAVPRCAGCCRWWQEGRDRLLGAETAPQQYCDVFPSPLPRPALARPLPTLQPGTQTSIVLARPLVFCPSPSAPCS